jgi:hypothetical protein
MLTAMFALACVAAVGCDDKEVERKDLEAAAAAMAGDEVGKEEKEAEAKVAAERKARLEAEKAKEAEDNAKLDAIAAAVVKEPKKPSKNLEAACHEYMLKYEDWVKAVYFDQDEFQINFFSEENGKYLGEQKGKCAKLASIPAADCWIEVIKAIAAEGADGTMWGAYSEPDRKLIQLRPDYLFDKCVEKFAPEKLP